MKIVDSQISLSGESQFQKAYQLTKMTKIILPVLHLNHDNQDKLEISDDARNALKDAQKVDPAQVDQSQTHLQPN